MNQSDELPTTCALHAAQLSEMREKLNDVHMALCGDERLGIQGLVKDVGNLKDWRRNLDLRVAKISGMVVIAGLLLGYAFQWALHFVK